MTSALAECRAIIEKHSKSFALAARFLPDRSRAPAVVLYAWCRRCDDAVDSVAGEEQLRAIARLSSELEGIYRGDHRNDVVLSTFSEVVRVYKIPQEYPQALLRGMVMDVAGRKYSTIEELLEYCHCVAGVVGLMMCHVLGVSSDEALPHAAHLGIAMQLTNICRDVAEDWERGRLYIPEELFSHPSVVTAARENCELTKDLAMPLRTAVKRLLMLAERYYRSGDAGMRYLSPRCAVSIRTARLVYSGIGRKIAAADYDVLAGRAIVPKSQKVVLAMRAAVRGLGDWKRAGRASAWSLPRQQLGASDAIRLG